MILDIRLQDTRIYQEVKEEGLQQVLIREQKLIMRQLARKVGRIPEPVQINLTQLSFVQLEELGEALLEFDQLTDVETWLAKLNTRQTEVSRKLAQTLETLTKPILEQLQRLSMGQLQLLETAAEDFTSVDDLANWLQARSKTDMTVI